MKIKDFIKAEKYCKKVFDGTHDSPKPCAKGYKLLTSKNILSGELAKTNAYFISEEDYKSINRRSKVQKNDILFSMIGSVGNVCLIKDDTIDFAIKNMGVFSCEDEDEAKYLYYYLQSPLAKKIIASYLNGAVQKFLGLERLRNFPVPSYTKDKKKIASVLYNIDRKISVNREINRNLEELAKQIYDYWFVQFDFPNEEGKPYKSSGGKMTFNTILKRKIPERWEVKSINDFCTSYRGVSYDKSDLLNGPEGGVLVLRGNNIDGNTLIYDENVAYVPPSFVELEQKIKKHDIIMTMSSGSKEHVGKCTMFQSDSEHTYGAFMTKFTPNSNCPFFAYRSMLSDFFKSKIKYICGGTGINNLTNQTFDEILFPFPPKDVLKEFEKLLTPIYEKVGKNNDEILKLTTLRDELLPMLMNGQVGIKE